MEGLTVSGYTFAEGGRRTPSYGASYGTTEEAHAGIQVRNHAMGKEACRPVEHLAAPVAFAGILDAPVSHDHVQGTKVDQEVLQALDVPGGVLAVAIHRDNVVESVFARIGQARFQGRHVATIAAKLRG